MRFIAVEHDEARRIAANMKLPTFIGADKAKGE
jgi:hypothetical protein